MCVYESQIEKRVEIFFYRSINASKKPKSMLKFQLWIVNSGTNLINFVIIKLIPINQYLNVLIFSLWWINCCHYVTLKQLRQNIKYEKWIPKKFIYLSYFLPFWRTHNKTARLIHCDLWQWFEPKEWKRKIKRTRTCEEWSHFGGLNLNLRNYFNGFF